MRILGAARTKAARTSHAEAGRDSEAQVASAEAARDTEAQVASEQAAGRGTAEGGKPERFRVWAAVPAAASEPTAIAGRRVDRAWARARAEEEVLLRAGQRAEAEPVGVGAEAAEAEGAGDDDHQGGGIDHA